MAKTQAQWKTVLETEKATKSSLSIWTTGLNKGWRAWLNVVALVTSEIDAIWDTKKVEIETAASEARRHTLDWYRQMILEWQEGDNPILIGNDWGYVVLDETKRPIVAVVLWIDDDFINSADKQIYFHAAKLNAVSGDFEYWSSDAFERGRLQKFLYDLVPYGQFDMFNDYQVNPYIANLQVDANIYYDGLILNSSGKLLTDTDIDPVQDAIRLYQNEYVNVTGKLNNQTLMQYVRAATGVIGIELTNQKYDKAGGTTYSNVTVEFNLRQIAQYLLVDTEDLTYIEV